MQIHTLWREDCPDRPEPPSPTHEKRSSRWMSTPPPRQHIDANGPQGALLTSDSLTSCSVTQNRPSGRWRGLRLQMHHCLAKVQFPNNIEGTPCFPTTSSPADTVSQRACLTSPQSLEIREYQIFSRLLILAHSQDLAHAVANQAAHAEMLLFA